MKTLLLLLFLSPISYHFLHGYQGWFRVVLRELSQLERNLQYAGKMTVMANFKRFRGSDRGVSLSEPLWCGNWVRASWKNLNSLIRHLADQSFSWIWSNLTVTLPAQFLYFSFPSIMNEKRQKSMMVSVHGGRLPASSPSVLCHQHIEGPSLQATKIPALSFTRTFWVVLEVGRGSAQRWIIILREQAYLYGNSRQLAAS